MLRYSWKEISLSNCCKCSNSCSVVCPRYVKEVSDQFIFLFYSKSFMLKQTIFLHRQYTSNIQTIHKQHTKMFQQSFLQKGFIDKLSVLTNQVLNFQLYIILGNCPAINLKMTKCSCLYQTVYEVLQAPRILLYFYCAWSNRVPWYPRKVVCKWKVGPFLKMDTWL